MGGTGDALANAARKTHPRSQNAPQLGRIWRGECWDLSSGVEEGLCSCGTAEGSRRLGLPFGSWWGTVSSGLTHGARAGCAGSGAGRWWLPRWEGAAVQPRSPSPGRLWVAAGPVPGARWDVSPVGRWRRTLSDSDLPAFATAHPAYPLAYLTSIVSFI